jgi:superfamily II DNA or RNA helicase
VSLRPYQRDALASTMAKFDSGQQRVAGIAATGAGKTVIFSAFILEWKRRYPDAPVLVLAHRSELLSQAAEKIRLWAPGLRVGLVQAGVNQVWADVIVASQQTLQRADRLERLPGFDQQSLIIVDECHRSMSDSYQKVLTRLGAFDPQGPRILGVTATFTREDSKRLTDFYQSLVFNVDIIDLIDMGYLVPPKFRRVLVEGLDLTAVRSSRMAGGKDLAAGDLDQAMERAGAAGVVAAAYRLHASDRPGLVFTPTVHSAEQVRDALRLEGITSEVVSGTTPKTERAAILRRYSTGQLQTVVNCAVLTEGFDAPNTGCVMIARPTMSKTLFRQMVGRGLRPYCPRMFPRICDGCDACKSDCLVLDMVGATGRNDLRTLNDVTDRPVDIREDELLSDAVKRVAAAGVRTELIGDAMVSGSLSLAEVDPWEAERRSKLTKKELAAEAGEGDGEKPPENEPEPPAQKLRYAHIPGRSGWFLRSNNTGIWFIPCRPNAMQHGFVCVIPDGGRHHVAVNLPGINWREHLVTLESEADAAQLALDLTLQLLPAPEQRAQIDPDARWRRRPATRAQLKLIDLLGSSGDNDEADAQYQGQAGDLITLAKTSGAVENFARNVVASLATVLA